MRHRESIDLDLQGYWLAIRRRWLPALAVFGGTVALAALGASFLKPSYESTGKLLFKLDRTSLLTGLNTKDSPTGLTPLVATQNPISTQIEILNSRPLLTKAIEHLNLKDSEGKALDTEALQKKLKIKIVGGTDVVEISYLGKDPQQPAEIINELMAIFIENDVVTGRSEASGASRFVARQLPRLSAAVQDAETALRDFKEKNGVIDLTEESRTAVGELARIDSEINTARGALAEINASAATLQGQIGLDPQRMALVMELGQSPRVQGIVQDIQTIERKLANDRGVYTERSPLLQESTDKLKELQGLLDRTLRDLLRGNPALPVGLLQPGSDKQRMIQTFLTANTQRAGLEQRLETLLATRANYQRRMKNIPLLEQQERDLNRRLEAAQSTYQTLLRRQRDLQVQENESTSIARVIEPATAAKEPNGQTKKLLIVFGTLFGCFLATATILGLESRDRSLKTLTEIRECYPYPLLGVIPRFSGKKGFSKKDSDPILEVPARSPERSLVGEMYRLLQANLKFLRSDCPVTVITITSALPKEGKSSVAANLAAVMAQLQRKVLLIDADMHLPSQHHGWNLTNRLGLSEVLVGQADLEDACQLVMDNLVVLPAGIVPPDPLALLDSKRMSALLTQFALDYDFIIIDAPPLTVGADALTLGKMTDGLLLVARPGVTDATGAKTALELLERSGQQVLGLVVNGVESRADPTAYFYHARAYFPEAGAVRPDMGTL
jgi:capsular exopolysaccharide synthesis family protein